MPLSQIIKAKIKTNGPMRLDEYIAHCLYDPKYGYYATKTVFGAKGDFVTAPEISQIFGEVTAEWIFQQWERLGKPAKFLLYELGAGRGVWLRDILHALKNAPECYDAMSLFILENSPKRRDEQRANIPLPIIHQEHFEAPKLPTIIISNEFFDALPIRQFQNPGGGWLEAFINSDFEKIWQPCPLAPLALRDYQYQGAILEWNERAQKLCEIFGNHLSKNRGAMLTIDYGEWQGAGETLQALYKAERSSPFENCGKSDITSHVRFIDLAHALALDTRFMSQSEFLSAFGGEKRLQYLQNIHQNRAIEFAKDYQRLTDKHAMGELFKVMINEA